MGARLNLSHIAARRPARAGDIARIHVPPVAIDVSCMMPASCAAAGGSRRIRVGSLFASVEGGVGDVAAAGQEVLIGAHQEPWAQSTARLQSPEGLLVGISYLPSFHSDDGEGEKG